MGDLAGGDFCWVGCGLAWRGRPADFADRTANLKNSSLERSVREEDRTKLTGALSKPLKKWKQN